MRALLAAALLLAPAVAMADDARPARHPASEVSVPNNAPAASTKTTTGARNQGPVIQQMNAAEKAKVEKTGK